MDFKSLKYHCLHIKWLQNGNVLAAIVDHTKMSTFVLIGGQRNPLKSLSVCSYSSRFFTTCLRQFFQEFKTIIGQTLMCTPKLLKVIHVSAIFIFF